MSDLMISVSGVRGIVGRSLTPELLVRLGVAFGTYIPKGAIVIGRDTRVSGEMVKHLVVGGLLATGCRIIDIGVVATPTLTLTIEHLKADGGVMISASHNAIEWNALKFFRSDGQYLNLQEARDLLDIYYSGQFNRAKYSEIQDVEVYSKSHELHVNAVLDQVDGDAIRSKGFNVALDTCNGSGIFGARDMLEKLGCTLHELHTKPDGNFAHYPEPSFIGLTDLMAYCKENTADFGCATDPDADRVAFVDETGWFIGEEMSLALCANHVLGKNDPAKRDPGPLICNMSTSRVNEDIANKYGLEFKRTPVGEVNVAGEMAKSNALIGGEGNGGVIYGPVHYGRDSLIGIALILESMALSGKKLSELSNEFPDYRIIKSKFPCPKVDARRVIEKAIQSVDGSDVQVNTEDGLRLDWEDSWVHLRPSNTEPILRVIAEAKGAPAAQALVDEWQSTLENLLASE